MSQEEHKHPYKNHPSFFRGLLSAIVTFCHGGQTGEGALVVPAKNKGKEESINPLPYSQLYRSYG